MKIIEKLSTYAALIGVIGAIGGVLVVLGMALLERLKLDDTVGAWPVHGYVGIWGGLAVAVLGGGDWVA